MLFFINQTHLILERMFIVLTMEANAQEVSTSKSLELKDHSKEENEEIPQPTLKDNMPKDWQFKKAHPQDLIIGETTQGVTTRSKLKSIVNLAFIS